MEPVQFNVKERPGPVTPLVAPRLVTCTAERPRRTEPFAISADAGPLKQCRFKLAIPANPALIRLLSAARVQCTGYSAAVHSCNAATQALTVTVTSTQGSLVQLRNLRSGVTEPTAWRPSMGRDNMVQRSPCSCDAHHMFCTAWHPRHHHGTQDGTYFSATGKVQLLIPISSSLSTTQS